MNEFTLNVYDDSGEIVKTCKAVEVDIEFGMIRSLMELLNVESVNDTGDLLRIIYSAWNDVTKVLTRCFPEMEDEDWEHVRLKELVPLVWGILKYSFSEILSLPNEGKN